MSKYLIAFALTIAACGGKKEPPPSEPAAPATPSSTPMTPEECVAKGGQVKGDIGDGKVACAEGERDLGRVNQGIEGAVCCASAAAAGSAAP
ncbi:MAG TPA: hypothetical protein VIV11_29960 [Kofleriaceae bacterium]